MLNLDAFGTISITGDEQAAEGLLRSILLELSIS